MYVIITGTTSDLMIITIRNRDIAYVFEEGKLELLSLCYVWKSTECLGEIDMKNT